MTPTFSTFLAEQADVVSHLEHIEDFILNDGMKGARASINYVRTIRDTLAGRVSGKINTTVKYDGAPSMFAGIDPTDGKFFVAKKSIFNKNPKVYKTRAEVHADTQGDLADKLTDALQYLPSLGIKGIIQGDFMYSRAELKRITIADEDFLTFQRSTIVYAVPFDSALARQMLASKIGIVWHTRYTGESFESMKAEGGTAIAKTLKKSKHVWHDDVLIKDLSGTATMTRSESDEVTQILSQVGTVFQRLSPAVLNDLQSSPETLGLIKIFNNSKIRGGGEVSEPSAHVKELMSWVHQRFETEKASKNLPSAKQKVDDRRRVVMQYLLRHDIELAEVFRIMNLLVQAKGVLIGQLNRLNHTRTFLKTKDGYRVTGQEGYVITDHLGKNAVKLVDRLEFSRANFSPDVLKGWFR